MRRRHLRAPRAPATPDPSEDPSGHIAPGLSADEESAFAQIAADLRRRERPPIPWDVVAASVSIVLIAAVGALLLEIPGTLVLLFFTTFAVALAAGLLVVALLDAWKRRL